MFVLLTKLANISAPTEGTQNIDTLWNILHHALISQKDPQKLQAHLARLAEASATMSTWISSPFSTFLTFLSKSAVSQLHHHWLKYGATYKGHDSVRKRMNSTDL